MGRKRTRHALLLALTLVGCDRAPAKESAAATVIEPGSATPTKVVVPTEAAPMVPPPAPAAPPPVAAAPVEVAPPTPTKIGSTAAAKPAPATKGTPTPAATAPPAAPAAPPTTGDPATPFAAKTLVTDKLFRIELAPLAPCKAAAACEAKLVVHALGGYKVNAEYPTKFVASPAPGVTVDGTGVFAVASKTTGTMTVTFRAAAAGTAKLTGALKLSVCTEEICEITAPVVAFDVPVTAP